MSKPKFTAGPYVVSVRDYAWYVFPLENDSNPVAVAFAPYGGAEERQANAALIAAAPDLYAACLAVLDWAKTPGDHGGNPYCKEFVNLAEAAIARAEGGAP